MIPIISKEELRREADYRRLKSRRPICLHCGFEQHSAALEFAHLIPSKFAVGAGGALCSNCHRIVSDKEKDMSFKPGTDDPDLETIGRYIDALGQWLERIAHTLQGFGAELLRRASESTADGDVK